MAILAVTAACEAFAALCYVWDNRHHVGNDTDQTGETVTAWFGDFTLGRGR